MLIRGTKETTMIPFKFHQYIQLKEPSKGSWGYLVKGYEYVDDELYLISGDKNVRHHINEVLDHYKEYILKLINNE